MAARISVSREQYLEAIRQLRASFEQLTGGLTMNQMTWQPASGERWSVAECLDHLAISTRIYLDSMQSAVSAASAGPRSGIFQTAGFPSAKFTGDFKPPPRQKWPAPRKIHPRATLKHEAILPDFLAALERVSALVESTAQKDLNSVRFANPMIPLVRFTVATGFLIISAHGRRHLWQAEQVIRDPDFPAS